MVDYRLCISMFNYILSHRMKPFYKYASPEQAWVHYKNMSTIILGFEKPVFHWYAYVSNKYVINTDEGHRFYDLRIADYLATDQKLRKALREEVDTLRIQGAGSICSRLLFLLASNNRFDVSIDTVIRHASRLADILSMPVPPRAEEARIIDLLTSPMKIGIITGTIHTWWIISILQEVLHDNATGYNLLIPDEPYEDYIDINNMKLLSQNMINHKNVEVINLKQDPIDLADKYDLLVVASYYYVMRIMDEIFCQNKRIEKGNILLVFNPVSTPLEEVFFPSPIVISPRSLTNKQQSQEDRS